MSEPDRRLVGWSLLSVATRSDYGNGDVTPRWAGGSDIELTRDDGHPQELFAKKLIVHQQGNPDIEELEDVSARVVVTDARVAIVVRRFLDKGGGWWGMGIIGVAVAIVANIGSIARARAKGAGKAVIGHVRYPWLTRVGIRTESGWLLGSERLRLEFSEPGATERGFIELELPKDLSAALVAQDVVRRAARHLLGQSPAGDSEDRERLQRLAEVRASPDSVGRFRWIDLVPPVAADRSATGGLQ